MRKLIPVCSVNRPKKPKLRKQTSTRFDSASSLELDDIEGQLDDTSHLDQARQQNESGFASKLVLKPRKKRSSERLRHLQSQLTDQYQISYTEALEKAHGGKSQSGRARGAGFREGYSAHWGLSIWMLLNSTKKFTAVWISSIASEMIFCQRKICSRDYHRDE